MLAAAAAVWCVAGPALSHVLRAGRRAWPGDQPGFEALGAPAALLRELLLTGYYPVLPWLTYLLAGMAAVHILPVLTPAGAETAAGGGPHGPDVPRRPPGQRVRAGGIDPVEPAAPPCIRFGPAGDRPVAPARGVTRR